jgi:VanZ family protein
MAAWRLRCFTILAWAQFFILTSVATYYLLTPAPGDSFNFLWDKALHFLCWFALLLSLQIPWLFRKKLWWAAAALFIYSAVLESLQQLSPPREFSLGDMLANGLGILGAYLFLLVFIPFVCQNLIQKLSAFLNEEST